MTGSTPAGAARHHVQIEVIFLRHNSTSRDTLAYRLARHPLLEDVTPDASAAALCHPSDAPTVAVEVLHSTSWRHNPQTGLVLTYAALPDTRPDLPAAALHAPSVVCSGDPLRPTPALLHDHHIAAHAVRHLVYLLDHDPGVASTASHPQLASLWSVMRAAASSMPTGPHALAHHAAERATRTDILRSAS